MKRYIARENLLTRLVALALSLLCLLQGQVYAQGSQGEDIFFIFPSAGLTPGQTLRLTLFNPDGRPIRAQVRVAHPGGIVVALGDGSVRSGTFHSFDFTRSAIPLEGEPGTHRIQLLATCVVSGAEPQRQIHEFAATLEVVEEPSGRTTVVGEGVLVGGTAGDTWSGFVRDMIIGVIPGQALRVTLFNPRSAGQDNLPSRVKLFDANGNLVAQSPDLVIPPGAFRFFDFDRNALPLPGEPRTGRLQVRLHLETTTDDPPSFPTEPGASGQLAASAEVIDSRTGRTVVHQNNLRQMTLAAQ